MEHYLGVARDNEVTKKEIGAVQAIAMAVSAGRINAQVREAKSNMKGKVSVEISKNKTEDTADLFWCRSYSVCIFNRAYSRAPFRYLFLYQKGV